MENRTDIPAEELLMPVVHAWHRQWLLLSAGDLAAGAWNCMTVGWGSFGVMWNKPIAQIVVRPTRHTVRFTDSAPGFTLCAFPGQYREALSYCGSHSGRDGDKAAAAGITPIPSRVVAAPGFQEAELIVECRTIFRDTFDPACFLDPGIEKSYPQKDYHRVYYGEILAVSGTSAWRRKEPS
jgi:flavin reductase (DIM6/NTAB) family NADH-FMN oxidoreductase RutF